MGKLTVLISTTPDGFAEGQHVIIDQEFFEFTHSLLSISETILFGRKTFLQFQERWPERLRDENSPAWVKQMAQSLHDKQKVVFSTTLKTTAWNNSRIINEANVEVISSLKNSSNGGVLTFGSLSMIESLTAMNMVDDYYFNIQPLIAGKGSSRFFKQANLDQPHTLQYIDSKPLQSGAVIIHYKCPTAQ